MKRFLVASTPLCKKFASSRQRSHGHYFLPIARLRSKVVSHMTGLISFPTRHSSQ